METLYKVIIHLQVHRIILIQECDITPNFSVGEAKDNQLWMEDEKSAHGWFYLDIPNHLIET